MFYNYCCYNVDSSAALSTMEQASHTNSEMIRSYESTINPSITSMNSCELFICLNQYS